MHLIKRYYSGFILNTKSAIDIDLSLVVQIPSLWNPMQIHTEPTCKLDLGAISACVKDVMGSSHQHGNPSDLVKLSHLTPPRASVPWQVAVQQ
jgi:hypothetical protein